MTLLTYKGYLYFVTMQFIHYLPTKVIFGTGKLNELSEHLPTSIKRVLIITGKRSSRENGSLQALQDVFKKLRITYEVFDRVEPNPSTNTVNEAGQLARNESPDIIVGLGGGSAMDAAKCVAVLATNPGNIEDYIGKEATNSPLPIVAIPTTAGTGSEVTQYAVLTDTKLNRKRAYASTKIFPVLAVLDPQFTVTMPAHVTIDTGMDALTHAIEGYLSTRATPISDILAIEAIKLIKTYLPKAATNGGDLTARSHMLYASMLAGMVISQTRTIMLHAIGYPLTTLYGIPHGRANAIMLPYVLDFLMDVRADRIEEIIKLFGGKDLTAIKQFVHSLGISTKLSDYGITEPNIARFVDDVKNRTRNLSVTPKPVTPADISTLYRRAL